MSEYINNIIYGVKSFLTGMSLTLKHFRGKKDLVATLQYPNEKWPLPERDIGFNPEEYNVIRSRLHVDIDDCIGCLQCERACPVDCIKIDTIKPPKGSDYDCGKTSHDTQKKMIVPRFTIDMSECMYCDLCVHPCPEECIYMVGGPNETKHEIDYEFSQFERHGLIFEFATATEQDILDIGGESYLKDRKEKQEKREKGENLEGVVKSEIPESSTEESPEKAKHKDPLLEIFNIVPDKVSRGIAKKAVVFGKRSGFDFVKMAAEVESRINASGRSSSEMSKAIESLKNYNPPVENVTTPDKNNVVDSKDEISSDSAPSPPEISDFNVKSLDFITDKMARGIAKKSFMKCKRAKLDINSTIDTIIVDLESNSKLDNESKMKLLSFKSGSSSDSEPAASEIEDQSDSVKDKDPLFDIKLLNDIEDKMIRGSAKKIYMAGKRANKSSAEVIDDILNELSDKMDDKTKELVGGLK